MCNVVFWIQIATDNPRIFFKTLDKHFPCAYSSTRNKVDNIVAINTKKLNIICNKKMYPGSKYQSRSVTNNTSHFGMNDYNNTK